MQKIKNNACTQFELSVFDRKLAFMMKILAQNWRIYNLSAEQFILKISNSNTQSKKEIYFTCVELLLLCLKKVLMGWLKLGEKCFP